MGLRGERDGRDGRRSSEGGSSPRGVPVRNGLRGVRGSKGGGLGLRGVRSGLLDGSKRVALTSQGTPGRSGHRGRAAAGGRGRGGGALGPRSRRAESRGGVGDVLLEGAVGGRRVGSALPALGGGGPGIPGLI